MARLRYVGVVGTVGSGNMTSGATSHTFTAPLTYAGGSTVVPTLTGSDYFMLSILTSSGLFSEVVKVTAYNSSTGAATLVRGQEGSTGVSHSSGDKVTQGAYPEDLPVTLLTGESVPSTTPPHTLIYREATYKGLLMADSPGALISLDETSGNFLDGSGNSHDFTPDTGVVRNLTPLINDGGKAASGDGTHNIASVASNCGITTVGTFEHIVYVPAGNVAAELQVVGVPGSNGFSLAIASGTGFSAGRVLTGLSAGNGFINSGYTLPNVAKKWRLGLTVTGTTWTFWVNGMPVAQVTGGFGFNSAGASATIGRAIPASIIMDQVAFYGSVLSADAMEAHAAVIPPYGPIGWWDGSVVQPLART